jgi:hypothetical protein
MEENRIIRKLTNWMPTLLNRPKGRPKERWWDSVCGDVKILGVLDWEKRVFLTENFGKEYLSKPKPIQGCRA